MWLIGLSSIPRSIIGMIWNQGLRLFDCIIFDLEHTSVGQPQIHFASLQIYFCSMKLNLTIYISPHPQKKKM